MAKLRFSFSNWVSWLLDDARIAFFIWGIVIVAFTDILLGAWLSPKEFLMALWAIVVPFMFFFEAVHRPTDASINWTRIVAGLTPSLIAVGWVLGRWVFKELALWI